MTFTAFLLIFLSVTFHAAWNLMAKKNHVTRPFYMMLCSMELILFFHVPFWTPVQYSQLPWQYWFWVFLSAGICDAFFYGTGICKSYELAEMSSAYPVMRSLPIIFTTLITMIFGLGASLTWFSVVGMIVVVIGCLLMPLQKFSDFSMAAYKGKASFFILLTAFGTTGYTICDSQALQVLSAAQPNIPPAIRSLSYYITRSCFLTSMLLLLSLSNRRDRGYLMQYIREKNWAPFAAGFFAACSYALVLIAMNYVDNVSYVQAFRQIGLPVGMIAGILFLKERCSRMKIIGVLLILTGLAMIAILG